jgi:hypothetical protein
MSINLRLSASASGTKNTFDNTLNFSSYGGSPAASGATNAAAVTAFNTAYAGMSGRTLLIIDPGTYTSSAAWGFGSTGSAGRKLTVQGYGVTLTAPNGQANYFGSQGLYNDASHNAAFTTTSAGSSTITLVTSGQTSLFTAGKWVLVSAIDMQGYGFPLNPAIFEFKKIASIGAGTLTFTDPLLNGYKSTWPHYPDLDGEIDQGGPGNVYVLRDGWDQETEAQGIRFTDTSNLTYGGGRVMIWTDCVFDTYGPCPSQNMLFRSVRCTGAGFGGLEIDKCVERIEFIDSMHRAVDFQSGSIGELYVSNMTQSPNARWRGGAARSNTFINLNTTLFQFNEMNYGHMGPTTMTNCTATTADWFLTTGPFSDYTEEGGGVLSYAGGPNPNSAVIYWAVPGKNCILVNSVNAWARSFQVLDVSYSSGRTYVTTNLPYPIPGTINGLTSPWKIANHPCPDVTMVNCTGNSLFTTHSALPAHTPFQSWTL